MKQRYLIKRSKEREGDREEWGRRRRNKEKIGSRTCKTIYRRSRTY
jgi:primase-polymerase (primpol)-like protein